MEKFQERFFDLQKAALNKIIESKISVSEFRRKLIILPCSIKEKNKKFVTEKFSLFEKAESIECIFTHISFYLSFIDFTLLEHIIKQLGSELLKEQMSHYVQDMKEFKSKTIISDALKYLPKPTLEEQANPPADFSVLKTKINVDINVATLEKLDEYGKEFADELSLSHLAFFLFSIEECCLLVTWLIPTTLETHIYEVIQQKNVSFFLNNSFLELSLSGKQLYSVTTKVYCQQ